MNSIKFGKWQPDFKEDAELEIVQNLVPKDGVYKPFYLPSSLSDAATGIPLLLFALSDAGTSKTFLACSTKVFRQDGSTLTDISKAGGYTESTEANWDYTVYGNTLILTNLLDTIQKSIGFTSVDLTDLGGSPPKATVTELFKDHLFIGNLDISSTIYPRRLMRSKEGDIGNWTESIATGCGHYDIPAWNDYITSLKRFGNTLLVYFTNHIWQVYYVGAPFWFGYDEVTAEAGALSAHSVIPLDNNLQLALGAKDIYRIEGPAMKPAGLGFRKAVLGSIDTVYAKRITHYINKKDKIVGWAYPTPSAVSGKPDKLLLYNYEEDRPTEIDYSVYAVGEIFAPSYTINGLDALGLIDDLSAHPVDSGFYQSGGEIIGCVPGDKKVSTFAGSPMESTIQTGKMDLGSEKRITRFSPEIMTPAGTVSVQGSIKTKRQKSYKQKSKSMKSNGDVDMILTGRFLKLKVTTTGSHEGISGIQPYFNDEEQE